MKKFNIRKVLDGLTAVSSPSAVPHAGAKDNDFILAETLQSEHFQLCKVGEPRAPDPPCMAACSGDSEPELVWALSEETRRSPG